MGLLDGGLQAIVGSVFGGLLLDGTLHQATVVSDGEGGTTETFADHPLKLMIENYSDEYRARAGIPATDVRIIILQSGVSVKPNADSQITVGGVRYNVRPPVLQDPAQATWTVQGSPV
jgi:hypothetical protein